ncbi:rCG37576 [Rattus norvegicus]|uniref:RCG37576 n=1 Tax=Rattus norvegicus TaxID=10116 RepID=A6K819_RAT|nr:rCG37576 [Rattus norvegicus]
MKSPGMPNVCCGLLVLACLLSIFLILPKQGPAVSSLWENSSPRGYFCSPWILPDRK